MTALENLVSNLDKVAYTTVFGMDQIVGTVEGTISSPAPAPFDITETSAWHDTGFDDSCWVLGIFSVDNGTTWLDFNAVPPDETDPSFTNFQTYTLDGAVYDDGMLELHFTNWYDIVNSVAHSYTVLYKAILVAKPSQGSIAPLPIDDPRFFDTRLRSYQKVALQGEVEFDIVATEGKEVVVPHNLGYVPKVRSFYHQTSATNRGMGIIYGAQFLIFRIETRVDENNLTFYLDEDSSADTETGFMEYRIYYDDD